MGFFQELKEDLSQAVTELMDEELNDVADEETAEDIRVDSSLEEPAIEEPAINEVSAEKGFEENPEEEVDLVSEQETDRPTEAEVEEMFKAELGIGKEEEFEESVEDMDEKELLEKDDPNDENSEAMMDSLLYNIASAKENTEEVEKLMQEEYAEEVLDETAVITMGMTIKGDVKSKGSMDIIGSIEGDIDILGKLNVTGSIKGNSKAAEVFADAAKVVGEIHTSGTAKIGASSVIIGNITATCAVIAGAVKGDIDVQGPVVLDTSAIVMGNIKSKSVQINNGAVIEGMCSQCYADINPTNFFDEIK